LRSANCKNRCVASLGSELDEQAFIVIVYLQFRPVGDKEQASSQPLIRECKTYVVIGRVN
jgi:hypothetical protein